MSPQSLRNAALSRPVLLRPQCAHEFPGHLVKMQVLIQDVWAMACVPAFLTSFQVLSMLLA